MPKQSQLETGTKYEVIRGPRNKSAKIAGKLHRRDYLGVWECHQEFHMESPDELVGITVAGDALEACWCAGRQLQQWNDGQQAEVGLPQWREIVQQEAPALSDT
jgi:hypothetical protein